MSEYHNTCTFISSNIYEITDIYIIESKEIDFLIITYPDF